MFADAPEFALFSAWQKVPVKGQKQTAHEFRSSQLAIPFRFAGAHISGECIALSRHFPVKSLAFPPSRPFQ
jgi:hypothetical protein